MKTETEGYSFLCRRSNGSIWYAGNDIWGMCSAWNHATNPSILLDDHAHLRSAQYAKAIKNRMKKLGAIYKVHYIELSNGSLWPIKNLAN